MNRNNLNIDTLYYGDNLAVLRHFIPDETVDLIYLDPPFNSHRNYLSSPQNKAFCDVWKWDDDTTETFQQIVHSDGHLSEAMRGFRLLLGEDESLSYLVMIAPRLMELRRVLKPTGSIYLHCDGVSVACLRLLMDIIFGEDNFLNTIVWCYGLGGSSPRYWPRKHDDILWYSKEPNRHYFRAAMIPATSQRMKGQPKKAPDYWMIPTINNMALERIGYPTQKPEALLERIILSSSQEGDLVLDPFCGSGTTLIVAQRHQRRWIGIDNGIEAIRLSEERLRCESINTHNGTTLSDKE